MKRDTLAPILFAAISFIFLGTIWATNVQASELEGTSWRLVKFEGGDGAVLMPGDRSKYSIAFSSGGRLTARIDCNSGGGTWKSESPNQLKLGPLALTMKMCPATGCFDRIGRDWQSIRTYLIKDGHLFLSLVADGGTYEFEPTPIKTGRVTGTVFYRERIALPASAVIEVKLLDVSRSDAPAVVISEQKINAAGKQVPFEFDLGYDEAGINERLRYVVQARILDGSKLMFSSTQAYPVITSGNPKKVTVTVNRVGR